MLQQSLEGLLIQGLQTANMDIVRHCLRTYATIDKTRDAEALVGQVLVKPYMDEVDKPPSHAHDLQIDRSSFGRPSQLGSKSVQHASPLL